MGRIHESKPGDLPHAKVLKNASGKRQIEIWFRISFIQFFPFIVTNVLMNVELYIRVACAVFFAVSATVQSQPADSVHTLNEVVVAANRSGIFNAGAQVRTIDSLAMAQYGQQTLADILTHTSSLYIKTYGNGSLATSSLRGGNANHTAVIWNGFNINSPTHGQVDLALLPVQSASGISIQHGSACALWGSGAVGGTINLTNTPLFDKGLSSSVHLSAGSYNAFNELFSVTLSKAKTVSSVKLFSGAAENNFPFISGYNNEAKQQRQTNAHMQFVGAITENHLLINSKQRINLFVWYQENERHIPPTLLQQLSKAKQQDASLKVSSEWKHTAYNRSTFIRMAYLYDNQQYNDSLSSIYAVNTTGAFISEAERIYSLKQHSFNVGLNNTYVTAKASNFPEHTEQNRLAAFASYKYADKKQRFNGTASIRQELLSSNSCPLTYSAGLSYVHSKYMTTRCTFSRVFRLPTLNDLYWQPGGNTELKPEQGYSTDAGVSIKAMQTVSRELLFEPSVYSRTMENWIIWLPGKGGWWSPQNMMHVWSRGIETRMEYKQKIGQVRGFLQVQTSYVLSTNTSSELLHDESINKQLIYVPMYSGSAKIGVTYKLFYLSYAQQYVGYTYTSTDNSEYISPFTLGNIYASFGSKRKDNQLTIYAQINNLWNATYQVVANRPMPLRHFLLGLKYNLNKPNKTK